MHQLRSGLLLAFAVASCVGAAPWQQAGASFANANGLKGVLGQGYATPEAVGTTTTLRSGFLANPLLVSNAPFVASPLSDLDVGVGFSKLAIRLDSVFEDLDDDSLTYSLVSSGSLISARISGDTLFLTGIDTLQGTCRMVVSASDGDSSVSDTFAVHVSRAASIVGTNPLRGGRGILSIAVPRVFAQAVSGAQAGRLAMEEALDGDHSLTVNLLLPGSGHVSVHIFDQLGIPVIALERTVAASDLNGLDVTADGLRLCPIVWNLRAADGAAVAPGVYLWKIELHMDSGTTLETVRRLGVRAQ